MAESRLIHGDCLQVMKDLPGNSLDALVTDPPAGISFLNVKFDAFKSRDQFVDYVAPRLAECLRVCKPGAVGLVWALPRTSHWTALAIEEAGWVIEDRLCHLFGTGFPKARHCLKPAVQDWWLCRKPGLLWLGVEECKVSTGGEDLGDPNRFDGMQAKSANGWVRPHHGTDEDIRRQGEAMIRLQTQGRWPANLVLDEEAARLLDEQAGPSSITGRRSERSRNAEVAGTAWGPRNHRSKEYPNEAGNPSRFFYCAKASKADRGENNKHPTCKPTALMSWLVKLACPPGGTVLDCFGGSGSTALACTRTGRGFVLIEAEREYYDVTCKRLREECEVVR